uniref:DUF1115 domain-containing protein n=1 Tax=Meloidogyne hapla TaxID=6305 RepID=A0A1I8BGK2_MELHA
MTMKSKSQLCLNLESERSPELKEMKNVEWRGFVIMEERENCLKVEADIFAEKLIIEESPADKEFIKKQKPEPLLDDYISFLGLKLDIMAHKSNQAMKGERLFFWSYIDKCPNFKATKQGLTSTNKPNNNIGNLPPAEGSIKYRIAIVTDMDEDSQVNKTNTWRSLLAFGDLYFHPKKLTATVEWNSEYKEFCRYNMSKRAMEINNFTKLDEWLHLKEGDGNTTKPFKGEWMTVKDDKLYIGSTGTGE